MKTLMPVLFLAHGSPMNAIESNRFTHFLDSLSSTLEKPKAILMISAHWHTVNKTYVQSSARPATIHDFRGFPKELYEVSYPAIGSPEIVEDIIKKVPLIEPTEQWGIDHGAWSVLKHVYPKANIPVLQLSIDMQKPPEFHYQLGKQLAYLRDKNVLIIGSGNIVHNLSLIHFQAQDDIVTADWANKFDQYVKQNIETNNMNNLINYHSFSEGDISVAYPDHYYPLLYCLGAAQPHLTVDFIFEGFQAGTLSMRSVRWN